VNNNNSSSILSSPSTSITPHKLLLSQSKFLPLSGSLIAQSPTTPRISHQKQQKLLQYHAPSPPITSELHTSPFNNNNNNDDDDDDNNNNNYDDSNDDDDSDNGDEHIRPVNNESHSELDTKSENRVHSYKKSLKQSLVNTNIHQKTMKSPVMSELKQKYRIGSLETPVQEPCEENIYGSEKFQENHSLLKKEQQQKQQLKSFPNHSRIFTSPESPRSCCSFSEEISPRINTFDNLGLCYDGKDKTTPKTEHLSTSHKVHRVYFAVNNDIVDNNNRPRKSIKKTENIFSEQKIYSHNDLQHLGIDLKNKINNNNEKVFEVTDPISGKKLVIKKIRKKKKKNVF
jgi:hypothetical protein